MLSYRTDLCPRGTFSPTGFAPCQECPKGSYQPSPKQTSCTLCPGDLYTHHEGAHAIEYCQGKMEFISNGYLLFSSLLMFSFTRGVMKANVRYEMFDMKSGVCPYFIFHISTYVTFIPSLYLHFSLFVYIYQPLFISLLLFPPFIFDTPFLPGVLIVQLYLRFCLTLAPPSLSVRPWLVYSTFSCFLKYLFMSLYECFL